MTVSRFLPRLGERGMMICRRHADGALQIVAIALRPDWQSQMRTSS